MNLELIPADLHYLVTLVEKWGLSDDGNRDEQLYNATAGELREILDSLPDAKLDLLNDWLVSDADDPIKSMTDEYVYFTCYIMAFDLARGLVKNNS